MNPVWQLLLALVTVLAVLALLGSALVALAVRQRPALPSVAELQQAQGAARAHVVAYAVPFPPHDHSCPNFGCCVPCLTIGIHPCCLDGVTHAAAIGNAY